LSGWNFLTVEAWAPGGVPTAQVVRVNRLRALVKFVRVMEGRPVEAVATFPEWAAIGESLDASLQGAVVRIVLDGGPPRWEGADGRDLTPDARRYLESLLEVLDQFDTQLSRLVAASPTPDERREPTAALLTLANDLLGALDRFGPESKLARFPNPDAEAGAVDDQIGGVLVPQPPLDPKQPRWTSGGDCHFRGRLLREQRPTRSHRGWLFGQAVGTRTFGEQERYTAVHTWREFEARSVPAEEAACMVPPWPPPEGRQPPAAAVALRSALSDSDVRQHVYGLRAGRARAVVPAGLAAPGRVVTPWTADVHARTSVHPVAGSPALGGVMLDEQATGADALMPLDAAAETPSTGAWLWGFRPREDGSPVTRLWWYCPPRARLPPEAAVGDVGLAPADLQGGPWLITSPGLAPLGWLASTTLSGLQDLAWTGRAEAMGRALPSTGDCLTFEGLLDPWMDGAAREAALLSGTLDVGTAGPDDLRRLARLELAHGRVAEATVLRKALSERWPAQTRWLRPLAGMLNNIGLAMEKAEFNGIIALRMRLELAVAELPDLTMSLRLAETLLERERVDAAVALYEGLRRAGAAPESIAMGLARGLSLKGRYDDVLAALDLLPVEQRNERWTHVRCHTLLHLGRVPDAAALLEAVPLETRGAQLLQATIRVLLHQRSLETARTTAELLLGVAPDDADSHAYLVWVLRSAGRTAEALQAVRRAVARFPDDVRLRTEAVWLHIADADRLGAERELGVLETLDPDEAEKLRPEVEKLAEPPVR
jgi:tetratricopeptide (TPR) repeat protein